MFLSAYRFFSVSKVRLLPMGNTPDLSVRSEILFETNTLFKLMFSRMSQQNTHCNIYVY